MKRLALVLGALLITLPAWGRETRIATFEGIIEALPGHHVYARVYHGDPRLTPIVVVNGLTQDSEHWGQALPELLKSKATVVLYDCYLQGRSLQDYLSRNSVYQQIGLRPILPPLLGYKALWFGRPPLLPVVSVEDQAKILNGLLRELKITVPVTVAGLSYGGGVAIQYGALYPQGIRNIVAMAPYVAPLEAQDQLVRKLMAQFKLTYPWQPYSDDEIYDFILRGIILSTYHLQEPEILKWGALQPYGASELVRGIRHMDAEALAKKLPPGSLHLVIAGQDQYIPRETLTHFWHQVPAKVRGSLMVVEGAEHKLNECVGQFVAAWAAAAAAGDSRLVNGRLFLGLPEKGLAKTADGRVRLEMPKTDVCENYLLPLRPGTGKGTAADNIKHTPAEEFVDSMRPYLSSDQRKWLDAVMAFFTGI